MYSLSLVRRMVLHFADLAGWEGDRYIVTLSRRTFDRAAKLHGLSGAQPDGFLGHTIVRLDDQPEPYPLTWINPGIRDFRQLAKTCAHEALHAARPLMPHGRGYERAVGRLLRGHEL